MSLQENEDVSDAETEVMFPINSSPEAGDADGGGNGSNAAGGSGAVSESASGGLSELVTLEVGAVGKTFVEKRSVLMSTGGYFRDLHTRQTSTTPIDKLYFPHLDVEAVRITLEFLKTCKIMMFNYLPEQVFLILEVANIFDIIRLMFLCRMSLRQRLSAGNAIGFYHLATKCSDGPIKELIVSLIASETVAIFSNPSFLEYSEAELCTFLNLDDWYLGEVEVFHHVKRWGQTRLAVNLKLALGRAFYCIRFPLIEEEDFYSRILVANKELFFGTDLWELCKYFRSKDENELHVFVARHRCIPVS